VCEAIFLDGITKGSDDVVLSEDIGESAGTVFSGKDLVAHAATVGRNEGLSVPSFGNTILG